MALKSSGARAQKRNKTKSLFKFKSRGHTGVIIRCIGVRANIHSGGADRVLPEWIQWGGGSSSNFLGSIYCGGVVAEIFRGPYSVG